MSEPNEDPKKADPAQDGAVDPMSEMAMGAIAAHELFRAYVDAGFSECQSLYVLGVIMTEKMRGAP